MIKINDRFFLERDKFQWILVEMVDGTSRKTGEKILTEKRKYYPKLSQACREMVELNLVPPKLVDDLGKSLIASTDKLMSGILEG